MEGAESGRTIVRATVHLQDLPVGVAVGVDARDPYIADLLEATFLVPVTAASDPDEAAAVGAADEAQGDGYASG